MRDESPARSGRLRVIIGTVVAGLVALGVVAAGGALLPQASAWSSRPDVQLLDAVPTDSPSPVPTDTPSPSPTDGQVITVICETDGDPPTCTGPEPGVCPIDTPSPLPTATAGGVTTMAAFVAMADPPCTIRVQQVVAVSEVFKAPKKPKVGDTVEIQVDIQVPSKAKDAAQNAIDLVTKKGKTVVSILLVTKVYQVDDLGALVVYVEVYGINVQAKGYGVGMGVKDGTGAKLALAVVLP